MFGGGHLLSFHLWCDVCTFLSWEIFRHVKSYTVLLFLCFSQTTFSLLCLSSCSHGTSNVSPTWWTRKQATATCNILQWRDNLEISWDVWRFSFQPVVQGHGLDGVIRIAGQGGILWVGSDKSWRWLFASTWQDMSPVLFASRSTLSQSICHQPDTLIVYMPFFIAECCCAI